VLASLRPECRSANLGPVALRCLIVDDSEEFLASARRLLSAQGVAVVGVASSGVEAVRLAEELLPDVALVDVELGEEDGIEVARRLAECVPSSRVVLISSHPEDELGDLLVGNTAAGFLSKTELSAAAIAKLVG
jgi:two-component system nitrate/nitrite response regulator NarL